MDENINENKIEFHKLTPKNDIELGIYETAIDYVFDNDDLKNIAITGPFCSGKSSIIETYKKMTEKSFINVSLAHFTSIQTNNEVKQKTQNPGESDDFVNILNDNSQINESVLEGKIINQLLHQINYKKISQTNFKLKNPFSARKTFSFSLSLGIIILFIILLFNLNLLSVVLNNSKGLLYFFLLILLICITCVLFKIIKTQHNKPLFKKFNLQNNGFEIFEDNTDSFFDKYLNEILYIFKKSDVDAIIFEDIDRHDSNLIFTKLREINYLLNNKLVKKRKINKNSSNQDDLKTIRFFYLIKDDIFTSKDRTKFFDFIIPVVPIIDSGNSYDKFLEYFDNNKTPGDFNKEFLEEIALYIDDMRILKNIYNEYCVYYKNLKLETINLKSEKLLAIIIYKNLFPKDFIDLQLRKGYIFSLFDKKEDFISIEKEKSISIISKLESLHSTTQDEHLKNLLELEILFIKNLEKIKVNNKDISQYSNKLEFMQTVLDNKDSLTDATNRSINLSTMRDDKNEEYIERKEAIEHKSKFKQEELKNKIAKEKQKLKEIENANLEELINNYSINVFSEPKENDTNAYKEVKTSDYFAIIKYLLRNGYISEDYSDYMSYFYEKSFTKNDMIFRKSVVDLQNNSFDYTISNPSQLVKKLNIKYYSNPVILNFDLFKYMLDNAEADDVEQKLSDLLTQLKETENMDFIIEFWHKNKNLNTNKYLVKNINKKWPSIWKKLLIQENITDIDRNNYLLDTFYYSNEEDIKQMNIDNSIKTYISSSPDFLAIKNPIINNIIANLKALGVTFNSFNYELSDKNLLEEIYKENLYVLNQKNIFLILKEFYKITESNDYYNKNYSLIMNDPNQPLYEYVNHNINSYMKVNFDICNDNYSDDEVYLLKLLNNEILDDSHKEIYIKRLKSKIKFLNTINNKSLWETVLKLNKVSCTKSNIISYYNLNETFDETITSFINNNDLEDTFLYTDIRNILEEDATSLFYKNIIKNNDLINDKYILLLNGLNIPYKNFDLTEIEDDKIKILIDLNIIAANDANLEFLRNNYSEIKIYFITKNIDAYSHDIIKQENFSLDELKELLDSNIKDKYLLTLLKFTNHPISINHLNISNKIKTYILSNNYDKDDLGYLISVYSNESQDVQIITQEKCLENINNIINTKIELPYKLMAKFLKNPDILLNNRIKLFSNHLDMLAKNDVQECLKILNLFKFLSLFNNEHPLIENTNENKIILEKMKNKNWVSKYKTDTKKPKYFRVYPKQNI